MLQDYLISVRCARVVDQDIDMTILFLGHGHQALPIFLFGHIGVMEYHARGQCRGYPSATFLIDVCNNDGRAFVGEAYSYAFAVPRSASWFSFSDDVTVLEDTVLVVPVTIAVLPLRRLPITLAIFGK